MGREEGLKSKPASWMDPLMIEIADMIVTVGKNGDLICSRTHHDLYGIAFVDLHSRL